MKPTLTWVPSFPRLFTPLFYSKFVCLQHGKLSPVSEPQVKHSSAHSCSCFNSCPTEVSAEHRSSRSFPPGTGPESIPGWMDGGFQAGVHPLHPATGARQAGQSIPSSQVGIGCSHNSCSPRAASPATQTQQNPQLWAQPVFRTTPKQ